MGNKQGMSKGKNKDGTPAAAAAAAMSPPIAPTAAAATQVIMCSRDQPDAINGAWGHIMPTAKLEDTIQQQTTPGDVVIFEWPRGDAIQSIDYILRALRVLRGGSVFAFVFGQPLGTDPVLRLRVFDAGAMMVAADLSAVPTLITRVLSQFPQQRQIGEGYCCPRCGLDGMSEAGLHTHEPLYHAALPNAAAECPICSKQCPAQGHRNYSPSRFCRTLL